MACEVRLQPIAETDLEEAFLWAAKSAPDTARLWAKRFEAALQTLSEHPERCALAPEHRKVKREIRQFLFGKKPNVFRVLFVIDGAVVRIIRIRRGSRRALSRKDLI